MTSAGSNVLDPNWLSDRMLPSAAVKPGSPASFSTNTATLQAETTVYQNEYVNYLKTLYPTAFTANSATPIWFDLDNEPDLWTSTHPEVRPIVAGSVTSSNPLGTPTPLTYTELLNDTVTYATAIKAVAPNTLIFGPVSYGWNGYTTLQDAPDSGTYGDFLTYYLNQTAAASKTAGQRLVNVLDLHWYPEATGAGIRITTNDAGYSGSTLAQLQAARVEAPRSLWDPTYVENSWITADSTNGQAIQLTPPRAGQDGFRRQHLRRRPMRPTSSRSASMTTAAATTSPAALPRPTCWAFSGRTAYSPPPTGREAATCSTLPAGWPCFAITTARAAPLETSPSPSAIPTRPIPRCMPATTQRTPPA